MDIKDKKYKVPPIVVSEGSTKAGMADFYERAVFQPENPSAIVSLLEAYQSHHSRRLVAWGKDEVAYSASRQILCLPKKLHREPAVQVVMREIEDFVVLPAPAAPLMLPRPMISTPCR